MSDVLLHKTCRLYMYMGGTYYT